MTTRIQRKTNIIDATNQKIGRLATQIATILIGKNSAMYQPNQDLGDNVHVKNIKFVAFDKKKVAGKKYYHHSGYPGGLKTVHQKDLVETNPQEILRKAVFQMLPDNKLRNARIKRLIIT